MVLQEDKQFLVDTKPAPGSMAAAADCDERVQVILYLTVRTAAPATAH